MLGGNVDGLLVIVVQSVAGSDCHDLSPRHHCDVVPPDIVGSLPLMAVVCVVFVASTSSSRVSCVRSLVCSWEMAVLCDHQPTIEAIEIVL